MPGASRPTLQETLRQRLPGQRAPPDLAVATANAADLTYGWHASASDGASSSSDTASVHGDAAEHEAPAPPDWRAERMARLQAHGVDLDEPQDTHERAPSSDSDDAREAERQADAEPASRIRRRRRSSSAASSARSSAPSAHAHAEAEADQPEAPAAEGSRDAQPPAAEQAEARPAEDLICRICFEGPAVAGGERLGKLIAPCRCRGTMKFVHTSCLTEWRMASRRSTSAMQCDQCGQPYRFRQSRFVGFAQSPALLFLVSVPLFLMLIWAIGLTTDLALRQFGGVAPERAARWDVGGGDLHSSTWLDDLGDENTYFELGYDSWAQGRAFLHMAKAGIAHVKTGGVITALADLQGAEEPREVKRLTQRQAARSRAAQRGWWDELKWVWANGEDEEDEVDERYGDRHSGGEHVEAQDDEMDELVSSSWAQRIALQFSLGFSVVGVSSFLTMLVSMPLLHLGNFGLGRGFVRMTGGRRRGNGRGAQNGQGGDAGAIATAVLLFLVFLGVMRALHLVYRGVRAYTRRMLSRIEDIIIDLAGETEAEKEERRAHEAQRPPQPSLRQRLANIDVKATLRSIWRDLHERMAPAQVPAAGAAGAAE